MSYRLSLATVDYASGHKLQDVRGLADYDLICPEFGPVGFVNLGMAVDMPTLSCAACRKPVGAWVSGEVGAPEYVSA